MGAHPSVTLQRDESITLTCQDGKTRSFNLIDGADFDKKRFENSIESLQGAVQQYRLFLCGQGILYEAVRNPPKTCDLKHNLTFGLILDLEVQLKYILPTGKCETATYLIERITCQSWSDNTYVLSKLISTNTMLARKEWKCKTCEGLNESRVPICNFCSKHYLVNDSIFKAFSFLPPMALAAAFLEIGTFHSVTHYSTKWPISVWNAYAGLINVAFQGLTVAFCSYVPKMLRLMEKSGCGILSYIEDKHAEKIVEAVQRGKIIKLLEKHKDTIQDLAQDLKIPKIEEGQTMSDGQAIDLELSKQAVVVWKEEGKDLYERSDFANATNVLTLSINLRADKTLKLRGIDKESHGLRCKSLLAQGMGSLALDDANLIIASDKDHWEGHYLKGKALALLNNASDESANSFKACMECFDIPKGKASELKELLHEKLRV